ncbi:MAG: NAD(P)/FAD-dependent oxidoreductase [Proteobacteria bacterium]|nr:NAD(P)/FAD-dependent oxidoreductase [Pseudomonadota bacterium]
MSAQVPEKYSNLGFDPEALREKYRQERDKRIRPEGNDQYVEITGRYSHFLDDPYVEPGFEREPLNDDVDVLIIGGGFGGMLAAARFKQAGITDIRIIESGGDFGGTWYWNRYPGAQCDIESYCYLPLLEELGYLPKEKYSYQPEIYEHSRRIADTFGLYDVACFQTQVTDLTWDEDLARWIVATNRNDTIRARFVTMASGPLNKPKLPAIPGIEEFEGHMFHTSRWDYDYTGGDHTGNLDKLGDKKVAVIGTGATAIQSVPYVGAHAKHTYVFQRTPSSVDERGNSPTDPQWAESLEPGWQRARRENFNDVVTGRPVETDVVNDGWTSIFRFMSAMGSRRIRNDSSGDLAEAMELADFQKMNQVRDRVTSIVEDRDTAETLQPWYRQFCKRPTFNDEFLPTFNRSNVDLIDVSETAGVESITPHGVVAGRVEYEVDCIIFATGFEVGTAYTRRSGYEITGIDGRTLTDYWSDGMRTLHGFSANGFPNLFIVGLSQNGFSVNLTSMLDDQAQHVAYIIKEVNARGARYCQPTEQAETQWVDTIRRLAVDNVAFFEACTPGYYNNEGRVKERRGNLNGEAYAPGVNAFNNLLAQWRQADDLAGLQLS